MQQDMYTGLKTHDKRGLLTWAEDKRCKQRLCDLLRHPRFVTGWEQKFIEKLLSCFRRYTDAESGVVDSIWLAKPKEKK